MPPTAMINPEIIEASAEMEKGWEGHLSVPDLRGLVPRSFLTLRPIVKATKVTPTKEL